MLRRDCIKKRVVDEDNSTEPSETTVRLIEVPVQTTILNTPLSLTVQPPQMVTEDDSTEPSETAVGLIEVPVQTTI